MASWAHGSWVTISKPMGLRGPSCGGPGPVTPESLDLGSAKQEVGFDVHPSPYPKQFGKLLVNGSRTTPAQLKPVLELFWSRAKSKVFPWPPPRSPDEPWGLFWTCAGAVVELFWTCFAPLGGSSWSCAGAVLEPFWSRSGTVLELLWNRSGAVLELSWGPVGLLWGHPPCSSPLLLDLLQCSP